ncbi:hypothetical protein [Neobacillus terrae]|uniref:hypothetical protein n=1 Tax=Neobacillus terrae TaxID=3034837 RepID=UPI001408FC5B|nr:hypothetical protein [Neobacillus terrae]NHM31269.1 hypothetical protein [Neobacillus terrae]
MSTDHTRSMLETMKLYHQSKIVQTYSQDQSQILSVRYIPETNCFEVTFFKINVTKTFPDIISTMKAIDSAMRNEYPLI